MSEQDPKEADSRREVTAWSIESSLRQKRKVRTATEFERQKEAFKNIPTNSLVPYNGQFIASRDGVIVDHDSDLVELTHRFFEQHGNVPVYITRVGKTIKMRTPFLR
jgi:hypothetical protein